MSRYINSLSIPLATTWEAFRSLNEGVDLRNEIDHAAHVLKGAMEDIADAIHNDPELEKIIKAHQDAHEAHDAHGVSESAEDGVTPPAEEAEVSEGLVIGFVLSGPAIISGVGKIMTFFGKKFGSEEQNLLVKIGTTLEHHGHSMHHKLLDLIQICLKPLIFWLPREKQATVANIVLGGILLYKVVTTGNPLELFKNEEMLLTAIEKGLAAIKATEIVDIVKAVGGQILSAATGAH
jgi:hypothetical protein